MKDPWFVNLGSSGSIVSSGFRSSPGYSSHLIIEHRLSQLIHAIGLALLEIIRTLCTQLATMFQPLWGRIRLFALT